MNNKLILRQNCLKKREFSFEKTGKDCLKKDILNEIISELNSELSILSIGIYYPIKTEISPLKLIEICKNLSIEICFPIMCPKTNDLIFSTFKGKKNFIKNKYGIFEPIKLNEINPDIIFVPMVGFDKSLNRLGYGKGFYDRTISRLRKSKKIFVIGLAYDNQIIRNIFAEDHDEKMDLIITDKKIYR